MDKQGHIDYWEQLAKEDFETAEYNFAGKRFVPALFFLNLSIEKILKANWVADNLSNTPPFTHDLQKIASETDVELNATQYDYLSVINTWNIEARYPDYKKRLYQIADETYLNHHLKKCAELLQCLQKRK